MAEVLGSNEEEENEGTVVHGEEEEENESGGILGLKRKEEREKATYSTASLPLGFVFHPTDEQLISHYLRLKNEGRHSDVQIIPEVDFFNYDPWDLPALSVIKSDDRRWFFFCLEKKNRRDKRLMSSRGGFWKVAGKKLSIMSSKGLIGWKELYLWYLAPGGPRPDWVMHSYHAFEAGSTRQNAFVLCVLSNIISSAASTITSAAHPHEATAAASTVTALAVKSFVPKAVSADTRWYGMNQIATTALTLGGSISCVTDESPALSRTEGQASETGRWNRTGLSNFFKVALASCAPTPSIGFPVDKRWKDDPLTLIPSDGLPNDTISEDVPLALFPLDGLPNDNISEDVPLTLFPLYGLPNDNISEDVPLTLFPLYGLPNDNISEVAPASSAPILSIGFPVDKRWKDVPLALIPSDGLPNDNISAGKTISTVTDESPASFRWKELGLKTLQNNITTESRGQLSGAETSPLELNSAVQSAGSSGGKKNEVDQIEAEHRPSDVGQKTFSFGLGTFLDTITQPQVPQSFRMWAGLGLAEPPQDEPWDNAKEIQLMDNKLSALPENPRCPVLLTLFLQRNYKLRIIPLSFFDYMPSLQILNLSRTGIKSLPESIIKLVSLKRLFLNDCHNFMVLSPKIGELKQLEVLDLEGTDIKYLPEEIKKLTNLTCLEVSLYGYGRRIVQPYPVVPHGIISALSDLEELSIKVNADDEWWNSCVEAIVTEVCTLGHLNSLKFYFPRVELLGEVLLSSAMWKFPLLSQFSFTVGHHVERIMSRLPSDVEFELERWERCLKYINGVAVPIDIKKALQYSMAFFLERHATVKKLSDFGIGNMEQLKYCVVGECNEVEFIIDEADAQGEDSEADSEEEDSEANVHEECDEVDAYKEDDEVDACEEDDDLDAYENGDKLDACEEDDNNEIESKTSRAKKVVLGSLEYLFIYYMKNLRKIWNGPVPPKSLSFLKSLTLRTCPQLTTIFTETVLDNLCNLEELTVEDCPSITTLVSCEILVDNKVSFSLPNLKRILLHYLPGLVGFSTSLLTAPKIEWLSFYNCPNLKRLLIQEVCSRNLNRIKGERSWWEALEWRSGRPAYLDDIFVPIKEPPSLYH